MNVRQFLEKSKNPGARQSTLIIELMKQNLDQKLLAYVIFKADTAAISACIFKTKKGNIVAVRNGFQTQVSDVKKYINSIKFEKMMGKSKDILRQEFLEEI